MDKNVDLALFGFQVNGAEDTQDTEVEVEIRVSKDILRPNLVSSTVLGENCQRSANQTEGKEYCSQVFLGKSILPAMRQGRDGSADDS